MRLALRDGRVEPDPQRRLPGRGAYICRQLACAQRLCQGRQKDRIFGAKPGPGAWDEFLKRPEIASLPLAGETS